MRFPRLLAAGLVAAGLVVLTPPTAAQAATFRIGTAGAAASVFTTSGNMKICDTRADSRRAVMSAYNETKNLELGYAEDADGANGSSDADCTVIKMRNKVYVDDVVYIEVWIQNGPNTNEKENYNSGHFQN
ncbi:hypothetical protein [Plantactinospora sonchi]|uniref:Uncharacterized protein n=1 Tax=Plantactinospora sonchi TaxID=1544735 RepID=A0ABU7RYW4_9ACTN